MNRNIFNIEEEYLQLINEIEEAEGEITDEIAEKLAINTDDFITKMKAYRYIISMLKADNSMIDDEVKRLSSLKSIKNNTINRLKTTMRDALLIMGEEGKSGNRVLDTGEGKFYTRKNEVLYFGNEDEFYNQDYMKHTIGGRITVEELEKVKPFLTSEVTISNVIDKMLLKEDLKNNVEVEGVRLIRNDSIIIK
jgi:hypothetical protein